MLEIRDRVLLKDGCSILSTVGARRFRVLTGGERDGYDTAQVEFLRDTPIPADQLLNVAELHNKVCAVCIHVTRDLFFFSSRGTLACITKLRVFMTGLGNRAN